MSLPTFDHTAHDALIAAVKARQAPAAAPEPALARSIADGFSGLVARLPAEMAEWEWRNEITPRLRSAGLDERYWQRELSWPEPKQEAVYRRATQLCRGTGAIVALTGPRGTGKTTIVARMIADRASNPALKPHERIPRYRKMVDLIAFYKPLYADFGSVQTDTLMDTRDNLCRSSALLVIDEIHDCDDQKMKSRVLTDFLDRRYAACRDTILISNQTPADFRSTTSDSILSRLAEHGCIIACEWPSFRRPKQ